MLVTPILKGGQLLQAENVLAQLESPLAGRHICGSRKPVGRERIIHFGYQSGVDDRRGESAIIGAGTERA